MGELEEVLRKIVSELKKINENMERAMQMGNEMAEKAMKPIEEKILSPIDEAKHWIITNLDSTIRQIAIDFSSSVYGLDSESIEFKEKLLDALKQIRSVLTVRKIVDEFLSDDGLEKAVNMLEKRIEWGKKSSSEKTKEAVEEIQKGLSDREEMEE